MAVMVLTAACTGGSAPPTSASGGGAEPARRAQSELTAANTARLALEFVFAFETGSRNSLDATAVIDYGRGQSMTVFSLPGGDLEVVADGTDVYLRSPGNPLVDDDTTWLKVEAGGVVDDPQQAIGLITGTDPGQVLDAFAQAEDVEDRGEEDVRGTTTVHYETSLPAGAVLDQFGGSQRATIESMQEQGYDVRINVGVWLDEDNRPRRIRSVTVVEGILEARLTMELFDFGGDVDVEVPADPAVGAVHTATTEDEFLDIGEQVAQAAPGPGRPPSRP